MYIVWKWSLIYYWLPMKFRGATYNKEGGHPFRKHCIPSLMSVALVDCDWLWGIPRCEHGCRHFLVPPWSWSLWSTSSMMYWLYLHATQLSAWDCRLSSSTLFKNPSLSTNTDGIDGMIDSAQNGWVSMPCKISSLLHSSLERMIMPTCTCERIVFSYPG